MKKKLPPFHDLIKSIDIKLLMISVMEPNRSDCSWLIGLTDTVGEPALNYFRCESEVAAKELITYILATYDNITPSDNYGVEGSRCFVYIRCA